MRRSELKKSVETYESQITDLRKQVAAAEEASKAASSSAAATQKELERALPFEREVKEKNLLIGKLRHEAVTLNEHLTKALRILKKGRPEDNVDRQIITNYFLHFLALDRSDPKKFEALQLISMLLGWTDGAFRVPHPHSHTPKHPNTQTKPAPTNASPRRAKRTSRPRAPRRQLPPRHPRQPLPPHPQHAQSKLPVRPHADGEQLEQQGEPGRAVAGFLGARGGRGQGLAAPEYGQSAAGGRGRS